MNGLFKKTALAVLILFFCVFAWLRFHELTVRPFHNDESVNAWFLGKLVKSNDYKYDPANYHGPFLYYVQLIPTWIATVAHKGLSHFSFSDESGITDFSIRATMSVTGLFLILCLLFTYNRIGAWGAFTAFVLTGFSCNMVYFSRYFIHETYFILFTLGIYLGATWYRDTRKPFYFYLMVISAAFVFTIKETSVITYFVMGFSVFCAEVTHRFLSPLKPVPFSVSMERSYRWFFDGILNKHALSMSIAVLIWFLLYTSFCSNWSGLADSFRAYKPWGQEGMISGHAKPFPYFIVNVLVAYELGVVILSALGLILAFVRKDKVGLYLSYWSMGMVGAYSIIPYKTVWCVITMLLPMVLLSGYGVHALVQIIEESSLSLKRILKAAVAVLVVFLSLIQARQTYDLVFINYDKEYYEPPYVHTSRDVFKLISEIKRLATVSGLEKEISVNVLTDVYWPLPYYLKEYPRALYWAALEDLSDWDAPLLVISKQKMHLMDPLLKDTYVKKEYTIRPSAQVVLYINVSRVFKKEFPAPVPLP